MQTTRSLWKYVFVASLAIANVDPAGATETLDTAMIEQATGLKGTLSEKEGVFKVNFPRKDIQVRVGGTPLVVDQGLTAWAAFSQSGDHAMVMGDIVLLESEVNPVMSAALDNGLEVTALHNHFLWDSPRVMFMHIGGMGEPDHLARGVGAVFGKLREEIAAKRSAPAASFDSAGPGIDPDKVARVLGIPGTTSNGVAKFVIGRSASMGGHPVTKEMGMNTWAAFAGSDTVAVVDGDFAMRENEVQDVLRTLRHGGISIVAIHNHMIGETPRYVFLHYWGMGPADELAKTLKAALDTQSSR